MHPTSESAVASLPAGHRSLRVLHVGSPTGLYGAERWILALVRHLPSEVHSIVSVLKDAPEYQAELCQQAQKFGVETYVFEAFGRFNTAGIGLMRRFIREQQIDILHTHGYKTDLFGVLAVRGTNCRAVTTPHGWSVNAGLALRVYEFLDRVAFMAFDAVAPLSEDLHRELDRWPRTRRRLHLIPNGVDLSEVQAASPSCPPLEEFGRQGDFCLGYIGQLIPRKGIDTLIRAVAEVAAKNVRVCLVGEGAQREELAALAKQMGVADRVHFFGYRTDRLSFLKNFDAFVLPSALEGIPRCVMESMAAEIPVIATDIPGCRDIVRDGSTGLLMKVGDSHSLATAIERLMSDPALRSNLASAGRALVEGEFSAAAMASRYVDLYRRVIASRDAAVPLAGTAR